MRKYELIKDLSECVCFVDDDDTLPQDMIKETFKEKKPSLFRRFLKWLDITFNSAEYRYWRDNRD